MDKKICRSRKNIRYSAMKKSAIAVVALGLYISPGFPVSPVRAQLMDQLKGALGSGQGGSGQGGSGGGGILGGLGDGMPSVGQASSSNIAGVIQYCIKNHYLGGGTGVSSIKDSLMRKATGSPAQAVNDPGYKAGSNGLLQTGNGQNFSLGSGGLKAQITQKVCDQILAHGKSLL